MDWKKFNFLNLFYPLMCFVIGVLMGIILPLHQKEKKDYPIEVRCYWNHGSYADYPVIECDSIRGDTLWKDGLMIINKNIINIEFK